MAFHVGGVNYLTKMTTDLRFLPAPSLQDPLLLHWFAEQLPWVLREGGPPLQEACLPPGRMAPFRVKTEEEGASPEALAHLAQAQKELLEEAARNGTLVAPSALRSLADPPLPPAAVEDEAVDAAARWQWSALQVLLYGSESYRALLDRLPAWFTHRDLEVAAIYVQTFYRNRIVYKFARTNRMSVERKQQVDAAARRRRLFKSASTLQAEWRGFMTRRSLAQQAKETALKEQRKQTQREVEAQRLNELKSQRRAEEAAAVVIQQRVKVLLAKRLTRRRRSTIAQQGTSASLLLAQSKGVALLEKMLQRHRAANSVMWEVYNVVCLSYEIDDLERIQAAARDGKLYRALQERLRVAQGAQHDAETRMRALIVASAEAELQAMAAKGGAGGGQGQATAAPDTGKQKAAQQSALAALSSATDTKGELMAAARVAASADAKDLKAGRAPRSVNPVKAASLEESRVAAQKLGPDGLPRVDVVRTYRDAVEAHKKAALAQKRLHAEVDAWTAHHKGAASAARRSATRRRENKEARAQQALLANRKVREMQAELGRMGHGAAEGGGGAFVVLVKSGGETTTLPHELVAEAVAGAEAELEGTRDWGVPGSQVGGQHLLLAEGRKLLDAARRTREAKVKEVLQHEKEAMKREGATAPLVELVRLLDVIKSRQATLKVIRDEWADGSVSFKLREKAAQLAQAGEPPVEVPPTNPNDLPKWEEWIGSAEAAVGAFEKAVHAADIERMRAAQAELALANDALHHAEAHLEQATALANEWARSEGGLRVLTSLQAPEYERLNRVLHGKRSIAYRNMCAEPVDTKIKYKTAKRELTVVAEAEALADQIEETDVQQRTYYEGTVLAQVLDGRDAPLEALIGDEAAQVELAANINFFLGESREDRVYVKQCGRSALTMNYSSGDVEEPCTELLLAIKKERPGERPAALVMQALTTAHEVGQISELFGVSRDNIKTFQVTHNREAVREAPTLLQMRGEAEELQRVSQERYDQSLEMKPLHKSQLRTWHRLQGALMHLRRIDAAKVVAAAKDQKHSIADGRGPVEGGVIDDTVNGEKPQQFLAKWMGVKDVLKSRLSVLAAVSERDVRTRMRNELIRAEGRLNLLNRLMEGCTSWPEVTISVQGQTVKADRKWNQGLAEPEFKMLDGKEPSTVEEERKCGRFCYYCATLSPPIRVQHRMVDCPKRKRDNAREYTEATMEAARADLRQQRVVCEEKMAAHRAATEAVRLQKQALLELAGAIKVLSSQEETRPPPGAPPPPPIGERVKAWRGFRRRRTHQQTMVMKIIARANRSGSSFGKGVPSAWGELKAVALMNPHPRLKEGPIDPAWLFVTAQRLDVDITPTGHDHHLLPFVVALARAPLPPHWQALTHAQMTPTDKQLHPKWFTPPPSDEFVYPKGVRGGEKPASPTTRFGSGKPGDLASNILGGSRKSLNALKVSEAAAAPRRPRRRRPRAATSRRLTSTCTSTR